MGKTITEIIIMIFFYTQLILFYKVKLADYFIINNLSTLFLCSINPKENEYGGEKVVFRTDRTLC